MRFLNPKTDFAFKKIFGSEQSRDILISFLNAILGFEGSGRIEEVNILDPYTAPKIAGMKDTYVDVKAKDGTGRQFIIEMQVLNVDGFEQRVLYNACKTYAGQLEKGEEFVALTDVIALTITDFNLFPERPQVINKFKLRADDGEIYSDDLELVFVELPKFTKTEAELVDIQDKWFYFLKHAPDVHLIPPTLQSESPIVHAFDIANRAGLTPEEEDAQFRREVWIDMQRGILRKVKQAEQAEKNAEQAEKAGFEKGMAEGKAKGMAEGERQKAFSIAEALLSSMDDMQIARITGLPLQDINTLRCD